MVGMRGFFSGGGALAPLPRPRHCAAALVGVARRVAPSVTRAVWPSGEAALGGACARAVVVGPWSSHGKEKPAMSPAHLGPNRRLACPSPSLTAASCPLARVCPPSPTPPSHASQQAGASAFVMEAPVVPRGKGGRPGARPGNSPLPPAPDAHAGDPPEPLALGAPSDPAAAAALAAKAARRKERNKQSAAASRARQAQRLTDLSSEFEQLKVREAGSPWIFWTRLHVAVGGLCRRCPPPPTQSL